nr:hypothetical protein [Cronobacter muytjensii]
MSFRIPTIIQDCITFFHFQFIFMHKSPAYEMKVLYASIFNRDLRSAADLGIAKLLLSLIFMRKIFAIDWHQMLFKAKAVIINYRTVRELNEKLIAMY